ncbi:SMR domain protein [Pseudoxanthomonas kalamensis DSM 18571]|uniref:Smr/MutS family protein n=1 Tax=Pseudoxanthomonas kalamensis TaxID=289483 RepID=UPI001390A2A5|nr:Smr/MutS family protein [Pseudoxanthomonas kalamensis]KAF1711521.1 SMR domain protein [Pseudoxanthomonas kalamensis DSM 18571]
MSRRAPDDDADDAALFRESIGEVRRLPESPPPPRKAPPRPSRRMAERDESEALSEFRLALEEDALQAGDTLAYRRENLPATAFRRLRRGQYAVQDELDLHGCDLRRAEQLLRRFLREAHAESLGCVRIIHGKGLQSDDGLPLLKNLVDRQLRQRAEVLAFHSAPPAQGGTGAVLVLLAQRRP